jgi:predicted HicB family RNase H-like nuclease
MKKAELAKIAAQYPKIVEWSEEDRLFVGRCPDLFDGGVHGKDEALVYAKLVALTLEWVQLLRDDGASLPKPRHSEAYSGKFIVRVSPSFHQRLALRAKASGESLNSYVAKTLARAS